MSRLGLSLFLLAAFFIILGVLLLLHTLNILSAGLWWPLILILIGLFIIWLVYSWRYRRPEEAGTFHRLIGDTYIGKRPWDFRDMTVESGLGNVRLDLTKARIGPGKHELNIYGWAGKIEVLAPAELAFSARGSVVLGSLSILNNKSDGFLRDLSLTVPGYDTAPTSLDIEIHLILGDVSLRRAETST